MGAMKAVLTTGVVYLRGLFAGTGSGQYTPGGPLHVNTTTTGTDADTNEKTLWSYTLPGGSLPVNGHGVRILATGTVAANGNAKTIRLKFGATVLQILNAGTQNNVTWKFMADVTRTGATAQLSIGEFLIGATHTNLVLATPAETLSGDVAISLTGQNGSSSANDIVFRKARVEYLPIAA